MDLFGLRKRPQSPGVGSKRPQPSPVPKGISKKKSQVSGIGPRRPHPPPPPTGLFGEKQEWRRSALKWRLGKSSPFIPGTGGRLYTRRERINMVDELFPYNRFKSHISAREVKRRFRELKREESRARTGAEQLKIKRQRKYLERELGFKGKY